MELEALIGLAALPVVIPALTEHIKQFFRAVQDRRVGADETATPWPLVADTVGILYSVGAWYSGWIPQDKVDSPLGAVLVGLVAALVVQQGYDRVVNRD